MDAQPNTKTVISGKLWLEGEEKDPSHLGCPESS